MLRWGGLSPRKRMRRALVSKLIQGGSHAKCEFCHRLLPTRKYELGLTQRRLEQIRFGMTYMGEPLTPYDYVAGSLAVYGALIEDTGFCTYCQPIVEQDTRPE